jgi:hypothetical protein
MRSERLEKRVVTGLSTKIELPFIADPIRPRETVSDPPETFKVPVVSVCLSQLLEIEVAPVEWHFVHRKPRREAASAWTNC